MLSWCTGQAGSWFDAPGVSVLLGICLRILIGTHSLQPKSFRFISVVAWQPWSVHCFFLAIPGSWHFSEWPTEMITSMRVCSIAQSCPTVCNPMDYSLPGSSVHGIFQARILEWVAISFSRGSSQPRDGTHVSCISCSGRQILTTAPPGKADDWWSVLFVMEAGSLCTRSPPLTFLNPHGTDYWCICVLRDLVLCFTIHGDEFIEWCDYV